jgi:GT2 family glycosyltransferase
VDNGSTDDTARVLEDFRKAFPGRYLYVHEPTPGLGRARNAGWRRAAGEIVAFTDDDCYPDPDYFDQMLLALADDKHGYGGGRVLLFDPSDLLMTIQLTQAAIEVPPCSFVPPGLIHGANFAFRRSVLERIGGFDDGFGAGTPYPCEDVDAMARASWLGHAGIYDPRPVVHHHHGRKTSQDLEKLLRGYEMGTGAYYMKFVMNPQSRLRYGARWAMRCLSQRPSVTGREWRAAMQYRRSAKAAHGSD